MSDILSTIKKLQALAERGIGGERTNAQKFLEKFMKEHDITESMLENPDRSVHRFYLSKAKERLFFGKFLRGLERNWHEHSSGRR